MRLFLVQGCPLAHRVSIVLQEKLLSFEPVFFERGRRPPELETAGPYARSPTLFDGDTVVWNAEVVLEYLEDCYPEPALLPSGAAARAEVRMLVARTAQEIVAPLDAISAELLYKPPPPDPAKVEEGKRRFLEALPVWNRRLEGRVFLAGDGLTLADVVLYTPFPLVRELTSLELPGELEHLGRWLERMASRPTTPLLRPASD